MWVVWVLVGVLVVVTVYAMVFWMLLFRALKPKPYVLVCGVCGVVHDMNLEGNCLKCGLGVDVMVPGGVCRKCDSGAQVWLDDDGKSRCHRIGCDDNDNGARQASPVLGKDGI